MGSFLSTRRGGGAAAPLTGTKRAQPSSSGGTGGNEDGAEGDNSAPPPAKRAAHSPRPFPDALATCVDDVAADEAEMAAASLAASQVRFSSKTRRGAAR